MANTNAVQKGRTITDALGNTVRLKFADVAVERLPTATIALPESMAVAEAIHHLSLLLANEEKIVAVDEFIEGFPLDAAHALQLAVSEMFGFRVMRDTPGGFFSPDEPPRFINVPIDHTGSTTEVFVGRFSLPGMSEGSYLETAPYGNDALRLSGQVKSRERKMVQKLGVITRQMLSAKSLYLGKAVRVEVMLDPKTGRPLIQTPTFIDTTLTERLVLRRDLEDLLHDGVMSLISRNDDIKRRGISTKRGALFTGAPGTGKTLAAKEIANLCEAHGFSFVTTKCEFIPLMYRFAKRYANPGAVLMIEDMDLAVGEDPKINSEIQNVLDGVDTKDSNVIVIFTTNHIDRIPEVLMRQGRMDVVIPFELPDSDAAARLVMQYGHGELDEEDFDQKVVGAALAGQTPASISEVLKRAKLSAIARLPEGDDRPLQLTTQDLVTAANGVRFHNNLLNPKVQEKDKPIQVFADIMGKHMAEGLSVAAEHIGNGKGNSVPTLS